VFTDTPRADAYRGARALVFGATGFIGQWVARALAGRGTQATLVARVAAQAEPLRYELGRDTQVWDCDVTDDARVAEILRAIRPHITFNLAGYGVDRAERDETQARRINSRFLAVLCENVAAHRDASWRGQALVHAGTQLEYGPIGGILQEEATPAPTTMYGRTKLEGTQALARCAAARRLPAVTARLFTIYGPGEHAGRLLPSLIEAARQHVPIGLTAGTQKTDFTYVEDVAEGLLRLGLATVPAGAVVNLATARLTSIRAFAEQAAMLLQLPMDRLRFGVLPERPETLRYNAVSVARLHELTGWLPSTDVGDGIRRTIEQTLGMDA
jgi:nucleoside-diphosphate-sugar epimerase